MKQFTAYKTTAFWAYISAWRLQTRHHVVNIWMVTTTDRL